MSFMKDWMKKRPTLVQVEALAQAEAALAVAVADPKLEPAPEPTLEAKLLETSWPDKEFELEYNRVAAKLGVKVAPAVEWRKLGAALAELMIPVYDLKAVSDYLGKKVKEINATANRHGGWTQRGWTQLCWIPLRESDVDQKRWEIIRATAVEDMNSNYGGGVRWNGYDPTLYPYTKQVPLAALLTAERIEERLPGEVSFFISDIVSYPDPFLAVMLKNDPHKTIFIVERWDEPGFRG